MSASKKNLTPAERRLRAQLAANTRWSREPDRHSATAPGMRAIFEYFINQVDPDRVLPEKQRLKMAENARKAHLASVQLKASKARRARNEETAPEEAAPETDTPAPIADQCAQSTSRVGGVA